MPYHIVNKSICVAAEMCMSEKAAHAENLAQCRGDGTLLCILL